MDAINKRSLFNYQIADWLLLEELEQDRIVKQTENWLGNDYVHLFTRSYTSDARLRIPTFLHSSSSIEFNLVFGGVFAMGLSQPEEEYLLAGAEAEGFYADVNQMKPVHQVGVSPFLMARFPCTRMFAQSHLNLHRENSYSLIQENADMGAIQLTRSSAIQLVTKFGFSLPSEAQWEYAYRGNTRTPYYFGEVLPTDYILEQQVLLSDFSNVDRCLAAANPFGFIGMQVGEWCEDTYTANYRSATDMDVPIVTHSPFVVRGGGALSWPWQGCGEWQFCMSANRIRSDMFHEIIEDELWAVRFTKRLDIN